MTFLVRVLVLAGCSKLLCVSLHVTLLAVITLSFICFQDQEGAIAHSDRHGFVQSPCHARYPGWRSHLNLVGTQCTHPYPGPLAYV